MGKSEINSHIIWVSMYTFTQIIQKLPISYTIANIYIYTGGIAMGDAHHFKTTRMS